MYREARPATIPIHMAYHVRTEVFEGPLDLLLQLITRHQVDVTAVRLTDLVAEYLSRLDDMRRLDLDVTSEFLLIAATLIQLKAQALLPIPPETDLDEELALMEERDRLLSRLLTCATFKDVAVVLRHRFWEGARFVPRTAGPDQVVEAPPPDVVIPLDATGLARLAARVLARPEEEPDLDHLDLELPSVPEAMAELRARVQERVGATFDELVDHAHRPVEVAAYFLALLELARWGVVALSQRDWLSPIEVRRGTDLEVVDLVSEWAG